MDVALFQDFNPTRMKHTIMTVAIAACTSAILTWSLGRQTADDPFETIESTHQSHRNSAQYTGTTTGSLNTSSLEYAAETSINAVVHVKTTSRVPTHLPPWYEMLGYSLPDQWQHGSGSGVFLDPEGHILTNFHVIDGSEEIMISTNDNRTHKAIIVGTDPATDLAVLKIETDTPTPWIPFGNSDDLNIGEWVLAVGNPLDLTSTVTAGIVSAKSRNINLLRGKPKEAIYPIESFIQTDAAINPGNSGGALVNSKGELVGINTAIASKTGSYAGYAFAVPASIATKVAADLIRFGSVQRGYLGIQIQPVNEEIATQLNLPEVSGCAIVHVVPDSGADDAGLHFGDVLVGINESPIDNFPDLQGVVSRFEPGDWLQLNIWRDGALLSTDVEIKRK